MVSRNLSLIFSSEDGKKITMTINNVKDDLTAEEIKTVMDTIISKNIFYSSGGDLTGRAGAEIIDKTITEVEIK